MGDMKMFVIQYHKNKSVVCVEGPFADMQTCDTYLKVRTHLLDTKPQIVSLTAPAQQPGITILKGNVTTRSLVQHKHTPLAQSAALCCAIAPKGQPCGCGSGQFGV
jgi:hypothetical protein